MKEKIRKILTLINNWKVILLIILIGLGLFYWYQIRPSMIYSKCHNEATEKTRKVVEIVFKGGEKGEKVRMISLKNLIDELDEIYEDLYKQCLRKRGINNK